MIRQTASLSALLVTLGATIAVAIGGAAQAQQVGTAAAVNPASIARETTGGTRTIVLGQSISHKERIQTTAGGSVQLLFLDKTSMTIGPNSDVSIDEYVFDPAANSGKLAATLAKGAMRFVGGQISHNGEATIKTATAVVGIRGGVSMLLNNNVYLGYGFASVDTIGGSVTLQAGEFTTTSPGAPPTPPGPPPPDFIAKLVKLFQSVGGQTGGTAAGSASQSKVAAAEQRVTGSPDPVSGTVPTNVTYTPPNTVINTINQSIQTTTQTQATSQSAGSPPQTTTLFGFVGGLMNSNVNGGATTTFALSGYGVIALDANQHNVFAGFAVSGKDTPQYLFEFGSIPGQAGASIYTTYDNFSAQAAHNADGSPLSTVDGQPVTGHDGQMFNVPRTAAAQVASVLNNPNLTICQCEYTRWGFWTSNDQRIDTNGRPAADSVIGGTWVAGQMPNIADMPTTGIATYVGHTVASINNAGTSYLAAGNFINTVDFAARTGNASITGLDGTNYSGTVRTLGPVIIGTLGGDAGNRQASIQGNFFRSPTSPVGEMGGQVTLSGKDINNNINYLGSGIFAAAKR